MTAIVMANVVINILLISLLPNIEFSLNRNHNITTIITIITLVVPYMINNIRR